MSASATASGDKSLLRRELGLWDLVLFNIAAVLGPRWVARAAHAGPSAVSLWVLAAIFFFLPTSLIIVELSSRFPNEGGIYVWTKEAFGDFHGFVCGWCYWVYTLLYFPSLLTASVAMSVYIGGPSHAWLAANKIYITLASLLVLLIASGMNLVGLNIGKWLQNAGGVCTYLPLMMLLAVGGWWVMTHGSATHFHRADMVPSGDLDTLNFWSSIAFAFTGMELICTMGDEIKNPKRNLPRSIYISAAAIAVIYILATIAVLFVVDANNVNTQNGVFQAISGGSAVAGIAWFGVIAALLVSVGNAGGVGATVAGVARVPFVAGIDNYLPPAFGKLHPKWRTPYVAIIVQAVLSALILVLYESNESISGAYEEMINATVIVYFIPFLYMYAAAIRLAYRKDRATTGGVLVPGGRAGIWTAALLGFSVTIMSIIFALIPSKDVTNKMLFEYKVAGATIIAVVIGLALYWRGARKKVLV